MQYEYAKRVKGPEIEDSSSSSDSDSEPYFSGFVPKGLKTATRPVHPKKRIDILPSLKGLVALHINVQDRDPTINIFS